MFVIIQIPSSVPYTDGRRLLGRLVTAGFARVGTPYMDIFRRRKRPVTSRVSRRLAGSVERMYQ